MPRPSGTRQKRPTAKVLIEKECELGRKSTATQKATSRRPGTSGQENRTPVAAAPATTSRAPTPALTSARHMRAGTPPVIPALDNDMPISYDCSWLTVLTGNGAPAAAVSEMAMLCGELSFQLCACVKN
jgi:hypothetical protein